MIAAILQNTQALDMDSYISIAVLIAVSGGIYKISSLLTKIEMKLELLKTTPARLGHIEAHLMMFEEDVNNLFGAVRAIGEPGKLPEFTRRSNKFRPFPEQPQG